MVRSVREWHKYKRRLSLKERGQKGPLREFDKHAFELIMLDARCGPHPAAVAKIRWTDRL